MIKIGYFHIYSSYLSCSDAFAHNYYKYLAIEEKKGESVGVVPPQKPGLLSFRNCLEGRNIERFAQEPTSGIQARL